MVEKSEKKKKHINLLKGNRSINKLSDYNVWSRLDGKRLKIPQIFFALRAEF